MNAFAILISICVVNASLLEPVVEKVVHIKGSNSPNGTPGIWRKKTIWKPRWIKEWKSAKVMKPTYRKVWSPVLIKEWIPFPKLPSKWEGKTKSAIREHSEQIPLWDPMPYPESQQPPPIKPNFPQPFAPLTLNPGSIIDSVRLTGPGSFDDSTKKGGRHCHGGKCGQIPTLTFTQDQISQIIGHNRHKKETNFSILPQSKSFKVEKKPEGSPKSTRLRRQSSFGFNLLQGLSQFLVPPMFPAFNYLSKPMTLSRPPKRSNPDNRPFHPPNRMHHNVQPPLLSPNKMKPVNNYQSKYYYNQTRRPEQFQEFESYNAKRPNDNNGFLTQKGWKKENAETTTHSPYHPYHNLNKQSNTSNNSNLIEPSKLVGEYHYSEFDYTRSNPTRQNIEKIPFKPLPTSMWPLLADVYNKPNDQSQPNLNARPRPIRKDGQQLDDQNNTFYRTITLTPSESLTVTAKSVFEQEKAKTKEIFPIYDVTTKAQTNSKSEEKNLTVVTANELQPSTNPSQKTPREQQTMQPIRLSEEALLSALLKNHGTQKLTILPNSSSSTTTATETTTEKLYPVYVVTPDH